MLCLAKGMKIELLGRPYAPSGAISNFQKAALIQRSMFRIYRGKLVQCESLFNDSIRSYVHLRVCHKSTSKGNTNDELQLVIQKHDKNELLVLEQSHPHRCSTIIKKARLLASLL